MDRNEDVTGTEAAGRSVSPGTVSPALRGFRVDPHWRNTHGGYAVRLDARTTIDVAEPVGRWRAVEPRLPHDGWRSVGKALGLLVWTGALGVSCWRGARRGTGPLGVLRRR